ncbi:microsomal prostaglandin-E synthase 1 [Sarotherodon galilaeus]
MPRVMWKEVPVVIVFEQNTYVNALVDVKNLMEQSLLGSGSLIKFYNKWSHVNNKYMLGKHVSAKTKLDMVLSAVSGICKGALCYCDTVMSLGWAVLSEATKKTNAVEMTMGYTKGAGSSNRMGSTMNVGMYKRSRRGGNLPTAITASVLESHDVISLPDHRLTDKMHAEQGKLLLGKLREEMSMVTITTSQKGLDVVSTGGKRSVADPKHVSATSGQDVGLHCESLRRTNDNLVALWTKEGYTDDSYVFFFWNKRSEETKQHADFHGRVRLIDPSMNNGNVSVIVRNVSVADTGLYSCMVSTGETGDRTELECLVALTVTEHSEFEEYEEYEELTVSTEIPRHVNPTTEGHGESTMRGELTVSTEIPRHVNPTTEGHGESAMRGELTVSTEIPRHVNPTTEGHGESAMRGELTVSTEIPRHVNPTTEGHGESAMRGELTVSTEIARHVNPTTEGHGESAMHGEHAAIECPENLTVAGHTDSAKRREPTEVPRHVNHTVATEIPRHFNPTTTGHSESTIHGEVTVSTETPRHVNPTTAGHGESAKHRDRAYSRSPIFTRGSGVIASLSMLAFILAV